MIILLIYGIGNVDKPDADFMADMALSKEINGEWESVSCAKLIIYFK